MRFGGHIWVSVLSVRYCWLQWDDFNKPSTSVRQYVGPLKSLSSCQFESGTTLIIRLLDALFFEKYPQLFASKSSETCYIYIGAWSPLELFRKSYNYSCNFLFCSFFSLFVFCCQLIHPTGGRLVFFPHWVRSHYYTPFYALHRQCNLTEENLWNKPSGAWDSDGKEYVW